MVQLIVNDVLLNDVGTVMVGAVVGGTRKVR